MNKNYFYQFLCLPTLYQNIKELAIGCVDNLVFNGF
jgi:hypothetical protein